MWSPAMNLDIPVIAFHNPFKILISTEVGLEGRIQETLPKFPTRQAYYDRNTLIRR